MPYDANLTRMAEQDLKDAYWENIQRKEQQYREAEEQFQEDNNPVELCVLWD